MLVTACHLHYYHNTHCGNCLLSYSSCDTIFVYTLHQSQGCKVVCGVTCKTCLTRFDGYTYLGLAGLGSAGPDAEMMTTNAVYDVHLLTTHAECSWACLCFFPCGVVMGCSLKCTWWRQLNGDLQFGQIDMCSFSTIAYLVENLITLSIEM